MVSASETDAFEIPPASAFHPIQRYAISYDEPRDLAEFYLSDAGLKAYHADFREFDHPGDASMRVMLVTIDGIRSEAVGGVQWRFAMRFSKGSWEAEEAGIRRKCNRGANVDKWTRDVCP